MTYLKPGTITRRVFNPIAMRLGIWNVETLVVSRRKSGEPQTVPVIPLDYEGARYVVSTRGESDWVRNLRAAGACELRRKGDARKVRAVELPVEERPPVIAAYRGKVGKEVDRYFVKLPDPVDHPVFRLE